MMRLAKVRSVRQLGEWMLDHGITPSENRHFGGVARVHSSSSLHYQDFGNGKRYIRPDSQGELALDVNDNDVSDSWWRRLRRGEWRIHKPRTEAETLEWLFKKIKKVSRDKGWPLDEMFFDRWGFRKETGYQNNTPISGHATHLHVGFYRDEF
jgi:hypothetical protein